MASDEDHTLLSVRGEARRTVAPDQASLFLTVNTVADTKAAAAAAAATQLSTVQSELAASGGQALTVETTRNPITWSTQSINTHEEYGDKGRGDHGPTGRYQASAQVQINVRDFTQLDAVAAVLTGHDRVDIHSVNWSVDDDNPQWALVRADAIQAALLKGQDYASALGGSVVHVEHVADAGLLDGGGDSAGSVRQSRTLSFSARGEADGMSLDPVPQVVSATIDARLSAVVGPLPER